MEEALPSLLIEVCVDSVESATSAVKGGADRLEVCGSLGVGGGVTPSIGLVKSIIKAVEVKGVPLMVMIRPRLGDFRYTNDELDVMIEDIQAMRNLSSVQGFVVGALTEDGRVDVEAVKRLIDSILPLEVCFHRAFDMTRNAEEALRDIIEIGGVSRILTSGHECAKVLDSLPTFGRLFGTRKALMDEEVWGLTIMPGSGINSKTVVPVVKRLLPEGLREIHLSAGDWVDGVMEFRKDGMGMGVPGHEWSVWKTREKELKRVRYAADTVWDEYWEEALQAAASHEGGEMEPASESEGESESDAS